MQLKEFVTENLNYDVCIVGGGIAGICAAISAARHGAKTALVQDRSVLGGNASSEIRMWICGAHGSDNKETGILEEILLENLYRNPGLKYSIWDTVLYEKVHFQKNLTLLLNTSCNDLKVENNIIKSIRCWQLSSQKWINISSKYFVDCSGDSVLRISGADFRWGREASEEFKESHAPDKADEKTMGNSLLLQLRKTDNHVPFIAPTWAYKYTTEDLPNRNLKGRDNFWWIEIGGTKNTITDAEEIRDDLYKIAYGVWDLIKNHSDGRGHEWELEWIGSLPGKRENVRYEGDVILNQNDVEAEGKFDDMVAYGGWSMDDHHPEAIEFKGSPTIFHPAPSPYGIPFRCLYSKNIDNLMMAGRNISATHMALSSTRVMATCAIIGQAVGTAAAIALRESITPREVYKNHILELQKTLMDDDCYLPWHNRKASNTMEASSINGSGDINALTNGLDRQLGDKSNGWEGKCGETISIVFDKERKINAMRCIFDSNLKNVKRMPCNASIAHKDCRVPKELLKTFTIKAKQNGVWKSIHNETNNYQRLAIIDLNLSCEAIEFTPIETWGSEKVRIFSLDLI